MIDWSEIKATVIKIVKLHAEYRHLDDYMQKPSPGQWKMAHSKMLKEEDQRWVWRGKRRVVDENGAPVAEWSDPPVAELIAIMSPCVVLAMVRTIEQMASIIAAYRNSGRIVNAHTEESVRVSILEHNRRITEKFVAEQVRLFAEDSVVANRYAEKLGKNHEEIRQELLKKAHLSPSDPVWLLTKEEMEERGFFKNSRRKRAENAKARRQVDHRDRSRFRRGDSSIRRPEPDISPADAGHQERNQESAEYRSDSGNTEPAGDSGDCA
jgi:hypothetical protein